MSYYIGERGVGRVRHFIETSFRVMFSQGRQVASRSGRRYAVQSHAACDALPTNHIHRTDAVCFHRVARDSSASLSLSLLYFVWVSSAALTYTD